MTQTCHASSEERFGDGVARRLAGGAPGRVPCSQKRTRGCRLQMSFSELGFPA